MGKKVLIVDDAKFMRMMLTNILVGAGYEIIGEAENGKEAFEKYKALKPDLVTMDITMPECDGISGLKLIHDFDKDAKVIMCSAMGQQAMVIDAIQYGAKDFIVKPFESTKVLDSIKKIIG